MNLNQRIKENTKAIKEECIHCKKCMVVCPMLSDFGEDPAAIVPEHVEVLNFDLPYSCLLCGSCQVACPLSLPMPQLFNDLRVLIAQENKGKANTKGRMGVTLFQTWVSSSIFRGGKHG